MNIIQSILIIICLISLMYYWNFMDKTDTRINNQMSKFQTKKYESKESSSTIEE